MPPAVGAYQSPSQRPEAGLMANDAELLHALTPTRGWVSIPDQKAATLIQPAGRDWRQTVKGPIRVWGSWLILGMCCLLIAFYLLRGKIMIDSGLSGRTIERFNGTERFVHWMTAGAFVVLAISGLNITYGRYLLLPLLGPDAFTSLSVLLKYAHNYLSFAFMLGVVLMFVMWVRHNIPSKLDLQWLAVGGGLFSKGVHPPADKFNAGQKLIFWSVIVGGATLSFTGIWLLFPFQFGDVSSMQLMQVIHAIVGLVLTAIVIAHIYIGSLGMEQAFDAMGTGQVDENWAKEHHGVWLAKVKGQAMPAYKMGHD
ncbi:MAG: formate dehydrogenase subunit gamma [Rhodospirillales bacterium]|nr:formate dehydrogenase subunit gamma [Rhodospirillales bacterium]